MAKKICYKIVSNYDKKTKTGCSPYHGSVLPFTIGKITHRVDGDEGIYAFKDLKSALYWESDYSDLVILKCEYTELKGSEKLSSGKVRCSSIKPIEFVHGMVSHTQEKWPKVGDKFKLNAKETIMFTDGINGDIVYLSGPKVGKLEELDFSLNLLKLLYPKMIKVK